MSVRPEAFSSYRRQPTLISAGWRRYNLSVTPLPFELLVGYKRCWCALELRPHSGEVLLPGDSRSPRHTGLCVGAVPMSVATLTTLWGTAAGAAVHTEARQRLVCLEVDGAFLVSVHFLNRDPLKRLRK